ncbi:MAG: hypothetical protein K6B69_12875 [Lachnospiraceae bacterium]|nr:hypothetical protein [Lachnospiraceae bacterium]
MNSQAKSVYWEESENDRRQRLAQGSARKLAMVPAKKSRKEERNQTGRSHRYRTRKDKSDRLFYGLVVMLVLVLFFGARVKAVGQEDSSRDNGLYYRDLVDGYTQILREELSDKGYTNSGITTTCIIDGQIRTYRIGIHHEKIDRLEEDEQLELLETLASTPFDAAGVKTELSIIR